MAHQLELKKSSQSDGIYLAGKGGFPLELSRISIALWTSRLFLLFSLVLVSGLTVSCPFHACVCDVMFQHNLIVYQKLGQLNVIFLCGLHVDEN